MQNVEFITWNQLMCVVNDLEDCAKENIQCIQDFDGEDIIRVDATDKYLL